MANDLTMEMLVKPKVDERAFNQEINKLENGLRNIKFGRHVKEEALAAKLIATMVKSGQATSETQARIQLSKRMGGGFTSQAEAVFRAGENIARYSRVHGLLDTQSVMRTLSERQLARLRPEGANVYKRFRGLESAFSNFKDKPTTLGALEIGGDIKSLRVDLAKLYNEYRAQGKKIPDYLRQISKNTAQMKAFVKGTDTTETDKSAGGMFGKAGGFLGKLLGIGSIATLIKKGWDSIKKAVERGNQALHVRAAYGDTVDWHNVRAHSQMYQMSPETVMSKNTYAADFRQRMMWGEISEREIIGLSRAGKWGRMVMSGEAARNPAAANAEFERMVATTDPAKMRSILGQLGLSQEFMNYRLQPYTGQDKKDMEQLWYEVADKEVMAASTLFDAAIQYKAATEALSGWIGENAGRIVQSGSPQGRRVLANLTGLTEEEIIKKYGKGNVAGAANALTQSVLQPHNWGGSLQEVVIQNQTINVEGNMDSDAAKDIGTKMGEGIDNVTKEQSRGLWLLGVTGG